MNNDDLISREALKEKAETVTLWNGDVRRFVSYETIDNAPTVAPYQGEECVNIKMSEEESNQFKQMLQEHTPLYTITSDTFAECTTIERPHGEWIPVSERLPEIHKEVIVTDIETSDTYQSQYLGNGYWECDNGTFKNRIIAWMPLPEPYKGAENE